MNQNELNHILKALNLVLMDANFEESYQVEDWPANYSLYRLRFISYLGTTINLNELIKIAPKIQEQTGYKINCLNISASIMPNDYTHFEISFNK